eukprot:TRINITY_DN13898_c0_g3_i3.p1 TRINITY_DN13898_c0_g3~~TRINITY_DN13898_c0_g3_i3.p1  ORF type:complete len:266 (+),score=58.71 TRINITY_DN13898_c0_g3_i3:22-798(+)
MAESFGTTITLPSSIDRQTLRENHPADTAEEYCRRSVAVPFLDHLLLQMNDRFQNAELAKDGLELVPDSIIQLPNDYMPVPGGVQGLADLWHSDLPDVDGLPAEYHRWCTTWRGQPQQPVPCTVQGALEACTVQGALEACTVQGALEACTVQGALEACTVQGALEACSKDLYPNIHVLLKLLCTLPITTAECERMNSSLRLLKNYLRSTMGSERLNGLALMKIHQDISVDIEAAVDTFALSPNANAIAVSKIHLDWKA